MVRRTSPRVSIVALSWKGFFARFAVGLMLAASLGLFVMSKHYDNLAYRARFAATDALSAVTSAIAKPADAVHAFTGWVGEWIALRDENYRLRQENNQLRQWQSVAADLGNENVKLRELVNSAPPGRRYYISARIAMGGGGPFGRTAVIGAGLESGVNNDFAVINEYGLVGRVLETNAKSARILFVTDSNSRIPVMSETSRERAIAVGTNGDGLQLLYLSEESKVAVGERIVTASDGGMLPPGLAVGVVTKVERGAATVKPLLDVNRLEYVSVVDFAK